MMGRQKSCSVGCALIRLRILGSIHVVFAGRKLDATQSFRASDSAIDIYLFNYSWTEVLYSFVAIELNTGAYKCVLLSLLLCGVS